MFPRKPISWEERLVRPIDVCDEYRYQADYEGGMQTADGFRIAAVFVEIETDEGVSGPAGPIPEGVAYIVAHSLRRILIGQDAIAGEKM